MNKKDYQIECLLKAKSSAYFILSDLREAIKECSHSESIVLSSLIRDTHELEKRLNEFYFSIMETE